MVKFTDIYVHHSISIVNFHAWVTNVRSWSISEFFNNSSSYPKCNDFLYRQVYITYVWIRNQITCKLYWNPVDNIRGMTNNGWQKLFKKSFHVNHLLIFGVKRQFRQMNHTQSGTVLTRPIYPRNPHYTCPLGRPCEDELYGVFLSSVSDLSFATILVFLLVISWWLF